MRVSIKDVAVRAGVAFQTVSKVLNGKGSVAPATRERILAAAEELGYVPDARARSVRTRVTGAIGVITSEFGNTTIAQHLVGVEREAGRHELGVIISSIDSDGTDCERRIRVLRERRVDGVIINAPVVEDRDDLAALLRDGPPVVSMHHLPGAGHSFVHGDGRGSAELPLKHLVALGHRRIAMVTGSPARRITRLRNQVYQEVLRQAGIGYEPELVEEAHWDVDEAYRAAHRLFDRTADITAVYVQNDHMAIGVLSALHERGIRVPTDCSVIGCDDIPASSRTIPPLTTVRLPFHETGAEAVRVLREMMADPATPVREVTLPVRLIYRSSTCPPHADPPRS
ncbi:MAG: LacI family DNA-binding transcriptional regulator [Micromonosporaceae bacterium]